MTTVVTEVDARPKLVIDVAATWFAVPADEKGKVIGCHIGLSHFIRKALTQYDYDPALGVWNAKYNFSRYDREHKKAVFPINALPSFEQYLDDRFQIEYNRIEPIKAREIKMNMIKGFTLREAQRAPYQFLISDKSFKPLGLACGQGKTAVSIAAACSLKMPVMVILGSLIDQWYKSFRQFTKIKKDEIFVVEGFKALKNLVEMVNNGYRPKVVLMSLFTMTRYAVRVEENYKELSLDYNALLTKIGIGTVIHDEVHLNFHMYTCADLVTNVKNNIYLSATYDRSDPSGRRIFDLVFPPEMIFGEEEIKRYSKVVMVHYNLDIPIEQTYRFKVLRGYLHSKYENYLLKHKGCFRRFINDVLSNVIDVYYIKVASNTQKLLILCSTKNLVHEIARELRGLYLEKRVTAYLSGDPAYGKQTLLEYDIIVSTTKSCSVGIDIKGLKTCINTVSFASSPQAAQTLGRLRQIPGELTYFVDMYNADVQSQYVHAKKRELIYRPRALELVTINL